jgi:hypothetical protein
LFDGIPNITALSSLFRKCAYVILGSIGRRFLKILNRRALNNGISDKYDWKKEVLVVTGGAGGIGGDIVKQLSNKGTRVVILDVLPLTYDKGALVLTQIQAYSGYEEKLMFQCQPQISSISSAILSMLRV